MDKLYSYVMNPGEIKNNVESEEMDVIIVQNSILISFHKKNKYGIQGLCLIRDNSLIEEENTEVKALLEIVPNAWTGKGFDGEYIAVIPRKKRFDIFIRDSKGKHNIGKSSKTEK